MKGSQYITWNIHLTPKGGRSLAQEAQEKIFLFLFFTILTVRSCPRLLGKHMQKVSKKLKLAT
jgi:hypothetical protein